MGRFNNRAFEDVPFMTYESFMRVVKNVKPYRGTDAYPVGDRRYSHRHFVVQDGKVQVWHCHLKRATEFRRKELKEESRRWVGSRHLVTVHPDNTVEFHEVNGIGDGMFLGNLLHGYVGSSSKHGGTVWSKYGVNNEFKIHPVFKGLRVSIKDHSVHPDSQYKMIYRRVLPTKKREVLGALDAQLNVAFTMLDSMTLDGIKEMWKELREAAKTTEDRAKLLQEAVANNHCLDVLVHTCMNMRRSYWVEYASTEEVIKERIRDVVEKSKRAYLSSHPEAFKYIEREPFDFPSASWGMEIKVGEKFAERL